jgi:hypothetical protein
MSPSSPSLFPGRSQNVQSSATTGVPAAPTAEPPSAAKSAGQTGCGCGDKSSMPQTVSSAAPAFPPGTASLTAPSLRPGGAGDVAVSATWQPNVHVVGLWSINEDRNCWAYLDTVGWRNLSGTSESGLVSMNMLAAHAYQQGSIAHCYEGDDGRISQLYVW